MPASRPQSHNEPQDLLLLQDYVCKLSHTQRTLEDTLCLIAANRTPCRRYQRARLQSHTHGLLLLKSLRIRVEARANVTKRAVIGRQLQLMQASVQHYPTEDLNTADTSCPSRTSAEHFDNRPGPCPENERSHPLYQCGWASNHGQPTASNTIDCNACICWPIACALQPWCLCTEPLLNIQLSWQLRLKGSTLASLHQCCRASDHC